MRRAQCPNLPFVGLRHPVRRAGTALLTNRPHEMVEALLRIWRHPYTSYAAYPVRSLYSETASFSSRMPTTTAEPFLSMLT